MKHKSVLCEKWLWCVITITTSAGRNCRALQNKSTANPIWTRAKTTVFMFCMRTAQNEQSGIYFKIYKVENIWTLDTHVVFFIFKIMGVNLLLWHPPLFWEGFAQDFGTWLQGLAPSHPPACYQGQILMFGDKVWLTVGNFKPKQGKAFLYGPGFVQWGVTGKDPPQTVATKLKAQLLSKKVKVILIIYELRQWLLFILCSN